MKRAIAFNFLLIAVYAVLIGNYLAGDLPLWLSRHRLPFLCGVIGGIGGVVYCLRGVYLSFCVRRDWDDKWLPWYFIRPIVSLICGLVSFVFLKAGLLVLDAHPNPDGNQLGFYALAFIAGLNVDKFITKVEDLAQATWGIERSRANSSNINEGK